MESFEYEAENTDYENSKVYPKISGHIQERSDRQLENCNIMVR